MQVVFSFFLRLFICLVFARFLLRALGVYDLRYLVALTLALVANIYLFEVLQSRGRRFLGQQNYKRDRSPDADGGPSADKTG